MSNYKYLGNKNQIYYFTRILSNQSQQLTRDKEAQNIYLTLVQLGEIKNINSRVVIFEFFSLYDFVFVTIFQHNNNNYKINENSPDAEFDFYEDVLNEYLKKNKCIDTWVVNMNLLGSGYNTVTFNHEESDLIEETRLKQSKTVNFAAIFCANVDLD